jgi:hypothetical protein
MVVLPAIERVLDILTQGRRIDIVEQVQAVGRDAEKGYLSVH